MAKGTLLLLGIGLVVLVVWLVFRTNQSNTVFRLEFFAGGSITGNSFEVIIADSVVSYKETEPSEKSMVNQIDQELTAAELQSLRRILNEIDILHLPSQDFAAGAIGHDVGRYRVTVMMDGKSATSECEIPPPFKTISVAQQCQMQLGRLRDTLNEILGVSIY